MREPARRAPRATLLSFALPFRRSLYLRSDGSAARSHAITLGDSSRSLPRLAGQRRFGRGRKCTPCRFSIARTCSTRAPPLPAPTVRGAMRPRDACMQTQCNVPPPNELQAYKDFHSKTTVVPTFAYPTTKIHSRTHRLIRPFNWFEELNVLFSTTQAMTLPLNGAFSCYRTQHPTGVGARTPRTVPCGARRAGVVVGR